MTARHPVRGHRLPHGVEAAAPVLLDVLLQRGENEVPVPLREGGGEEGVGQEDERQAARHEEPRVPEAEAEAEGARQPPAGLRTARRT